MGQYKWSIYFCNQIGLSIFWDKSEIVLSIAMWKIHYGRENYATGFHYENQIGLKDG